MVLHSQEDSQTTWILNFKYQSGFEVPVMQRELNRVYKLMNMIWKVVGSILNKNTSEKQEDEQIRKGCTQS